MRLKTLLGFFFAGTLSTQATNFWRDFETLLVAGQSKTLADHVLQLSRFQNEDSQERLLYRKNALIYFISTGGKFGFSQRPATLEEEVIFKRALVFVTLVHENYETGHVLTLMGSRRGFGLVRECKVDKFHLIEAQKVINTTRILLQAYQSNNDSNRDYIAGLLKVRFQKSFSPTEWGMYLDRFRKISIGNLNAQIMSILAAHRSIIPDAPIPDVCLCLPKEHLPTDPAIRRKLLENYFIDQLPTVTVQPNGLEILLERPATPYGCYQFDPSIREGLDWWERKTRVRDIPFAHRFLKDGLLLSIEDQWMPLSWSYCFKRLGAVPHELVLLHLDDHKDMMSPRIGKLPNGELVDSITGKNISFMEPETIESAILSGSIGKGSILTPLIHKVGKIHVRHLSFRPDNGETFKIITCLGKDEVLCSAVNRLELRLEEKPLDGVLTSCSNYLITSDEGRWLMSLPDTVPILLHIDMDFFNDRFDGNDNWEEEHKRSYNPTVDEQKVIADRVFNAIQKNRLGKRIIDVCIGISPSFYPAEYWSVMVPYVIKKCEETVASFKST